MAKYIIHEDKVIDGKATHRTRGIYRSADDAERRMWELSDDAMNKWDFDTREVSEDGRTFDVFNEEQPYREFVHWKAFAMPEEGVTLIV